MTERDLLAVDRGRDSRIRGRNSSHSGRHSRKDQPDEAGTDKTREPNVSTERGAVSWQRPVWTHRWSQAARRHQEGSRG